MAWVEEAAEDAVVAAAPAQGNGQWVEDSQAAPQKPGIPGAIDGFYKSYMKGSGMVDRAIVQGVPNMIAGIPALAADAYDSLSNAAIKGYNALTPTTGERLVPIPPFRHSQALNKIGEASADALDLPKPETKMGKGLLNIGSAGASAFGGAGLAKAAQLLGPATGSATKFGLLLDSLAEAPALQAAGAAGSVAATDIARDAGLTNPMALVGIGMLGGTVPGATASVGGRVAGGVGQLAAPFRSVGESGFLPGISREVIAGKAYNKLATTPGITPQVLDAGAELVPGSAPTMAQVSRDPGLISGEVGIRNALDTNGRISQRLGEQNAARQAELDRMILPSRPVPEGGSPQKGTLEYAQAKRDRAVDENKNAAFEDAGAFGLGDTATVLSRIQEIRNSPSAGPRKAVQDAMNFAEERLTQRGVNLNDPETLYSIRKDLGLARDGKYNTDKSDFRLAKGELQTVIGSLDDAIDSAAPGYRKYMDLYAKRSKALSQQEALRDLREKGQVSGSDQATGERVLTLGKFGTEVRKRLANGELGPGVDNANLSDPQINRLVNIVEDLDRGAATTASTVKPAGSDTFRNLSVASVIGRVLGDNVPDTALGKIAQTAFAPLTLLYKVTGSDEVINQMIVDAILDPKTGARFMRAANEHEIQSIAKELADRVGKQAQGSTIYGAANQQ